MSKIANNLRIEILKKYERQGDFAEAMGIHESTVSQILRGRRKLSPIDAQKWQEKLNCPPSVIESVTDQK